MDFGFLEGQDQISGLFVFSEPNMQSMEIVCMKTAVLSRVRSQISNSQGCEVSFLSGCRCIPGPRLPAPGQLPKLQSELDRHTCADAPREGASQAAVPSATPPDTLFISPRNRCHNSALGRNRLLSVIDQNRRGIQRKAGAFHSVTSQRQWRWQAGRPWGAQ